MNKAEQQILEKMARAIYGECPFEGVDFDELRSPCPDCMFMDEYVSVMAQAQAALKALDIIILEEGAEPVAGDTLSDGNGHFYYIDIDTDKSALEINISQAKRHIKHSNMKIIQRLEDGIYKPVITIGKE